MKRLLTVLLCVTSLASTQANPGPGPKTEAASLRSSALANVGSLVKAGSSANVGSLANAGTARFRFKNLIPGMEANDSILIIFDRYDHTGAGIIHQVFAADSDKGITVPDIAPGKYYVTVQCIGIHRDRLETVVTIRPQHNETVRLTLTLLEAFSKMNVVIPAFHPDLSNLAVTRFK